MKDLTIYFMFVPLILLSYMIIMFLNHMMDTGFSWFLTVITFGVVMAIIMLVRLQIYIYNDNKNEKIQKCV
jgi:hypothetical protein